MQSLSRFCYSSTTTKHTKTQNTKQNTKQQLVHLVEKQSKKECSGPGCSEVPSFLWFDL